MKDSAINNGFLPISARDMQQRRWPELDILFISGDAYVDHPSFGTALLARVLEDKGFRVGILAQPDWKDLASFQVMGRPRLFAAITAGAMDSMVNHFTAAKKIRSNDAYTPGGRAGQRPNRAVIAYTAAVKGAFKGLPVIIGGLEASLRRFAHYDYWDDKVRRSVLVDSKADLLVYGMAESALVEIAERVNQGESIAELRDIRGTAFLSDKAPQDAITLPSYETVANDPDAYGAAFKTIMQQSNPFSGQPLAQQHEQRFVVVNTPAAPLSTAALDRIYALPFKRCPHPQYRDRIPAYEQIRHSITSHRGCFGGCAFCAITHHQGKYIQSRSRESILEEITILSDQPDFYGTISDIGGPTANMYGLNCGNPAAQEKCQRLSCLYPEICKNLNTDASQAVALLRQVRQNKKVKNVFIASGIRYDLLSVQERYFDDLMRYHVGGLLKVAPESMVNKVTEVMRKPGAQVFTEFLDRFRQRSHDLGLRQAIVPYLISGHPGCTLEDMLEVALYLKRHQLKVEQVQDFTPTPGSLSTCIYHTGKDPFSGQTIHVPRGAKEKRLQKALLLFHKPESRKDVLEALRICRRQDLAKELLGTTARPTNKNLSQPKPPLSAPRRRERKKR
ncbi:YgiQ family radical SAM protein [Pelobacter seleniigenes]|uniref:YgiQ family radical SAM protein n=1 Tax=Pelobacter seleniigenes TaxID=407188 RepID=UPI000A054CBD|nr:YgiQ family radical SAM protein [Pelobacter seleniigenes]